jgi:hypothetical protein
LDQGGEHLAVTVNLIAAIIQQIFAVPRLRRARSPEERFSKEFGMGAVQTTLILRIFNIYK